MSNRTRTRAEKALAHYNRAVHYGFTLGSVANQGPRARASVYCYCGNTATTGSPSVNRDALHLAAFREASPDLPLAVLEIKQVSIRRPAQTQPRRQCEVIIHIEDLADGGKDRYQDALARYVPSTMGNNDRCITGDATNNIHFEYSGL